jgi:hypothetical protein
LLIHKVYTIPLGLSQDLSEKIKTGAINSRFINLHLVSFLENHCTNGYESLAVDGSHNQKPAHFYPRRE